MLLLDMVLGNQDRLPLESLGWRGNPGNLLFCPTGEFRDRTVAIDTLVQRRPPRSAAAAGCAALHAAAGASAGTQLRHGSCFPDRSGCPSRPGPQQALQASSCAGGQLPGHTGRGSAAAQA